MPNNNNVSTLSSVDEHRPQQSVEDGNSKMNHIKVSEAGSATSNVTIGSDKCDNNKIVESGVANDSFSTNGKGSSSNDNDKDNNNSSSPDSYSHREHLFLVFVGVLLSFNSGYINGCCLSGLLTSKGLRQSVAGFTGAYTISALALADGNFLKFGFNVKMLLSFIFGSFIAGFITPEAQAYRIAPTYGPTFLIGCVFLTSASVLSAVHVERYHVFYLAAAANGIQNGMTSLYSANLIRSTHLTGTSTDIGLFIGQYLRGNKKNLWKLQVLVSFATSFWLGGLVSFYATDRLTSWSLLFNAGLFFFIGCSLIWFLVKELKISIYAALFGTWNWEKFVEKLLVLEGTQDMMAIFDVVDTDKSGQIDEEELFEALKRSGFNLTKQQSQSMLKVADADGDGNISREEWEQMVKSIQSKQ